MVKVFSTFPCHMQNIQLIWTKIQYISINYNLLYLDHDWKAYHLSEAFITLQSQDSRLFHCSFSSCLVSHDINIWLWIAPIQIELEFIQITILEWPNYQDVSKKTKLFQLLAMQTNPVPNRDYTNKQEQNNFCSHCNLALNYILHAYLPTTKDFQKIKIGYFIF